MTPPKCLHCQTKMEEGHIADMIERDVGFSLHWQSGEPQLRRSLGAKILYKPANDYLIKAYRCPECGYVALFAPDAG